MVNNMKRRISEMVA